MKTKHSAVDLTELAIGIIILGIVVSIGVTIVSNVGTSQVTSLPTYQVVNETISVTSAGTPLSTGWVQGVNTITNQTTGAIITTGNYSSSINAGNGQGTVSNITAQTLASSGSWNVTYTVYNKTDPRFAIPNASAVGLGEFGNWFKILTIVGIAAVILGIIFVTFGKNKGGQVGGSY